MKRPRASRMRRILMWSAGVVLGLSAAAWVTSLFGVCWIPPSGRWGVALGYGALWFAQDQNIDFPGWHVEGWDGWMLVWSPGTPSGYWGAWVMPLWMPATVAGVVLARALLMGRLERRRRRAGLCPSCGYNLTGITGPCPECGHAHAHPRGGEQ